MQANLVNEKERKEHTIVERNLKRFNNTVLSQAEERETIDLLTSSSSEEIEQLETAVKFQEINELNEMKEEK